MHYHNHSFPVVTLNTFSSQYEKALAQQKTYLMQLQQERKEDKSLHAGYLLLGEHDSVYTLGKHGKEHNILFNETTGVYPNVSVIRTNRGGDVTYHGPGQLVGYPVLDLRMLGIGPKQYIYQLEEVILLLLQEIDIQGIRDPHAAGVWLPANHNLPIRKICAIGVHFTQGITMHGFAFNVNTDLRYFNYIHPCGFTDRGVCSIESEIKKKISIEWIIECYIKYFIQVFNVQIKNKELLLSPTSRS